MRPSVEGNVDAEGNERRADITFHSVLREGGAVARRLSRSVLLRSAKRFGTKVLVIFFAVSWQQIAHETISHTNYPDLGDWIYAGTVLLLAHMLAPQLVNQGKTGKFVLEVLGEMSGWAAPMRRCST